jgi:hypothetical protein
MLVLKPLERLPKTSSQILLSLEQLVEHQAEEEVDEAVPKGMV